VLYITHRTPYPPDKGDRIRNYHVLRHLARHAEVDLATLADEPVADATRIHLERLCNRLAIQPVGRVGMAFKGLVHLATGRSLTTAAFASARLARQIEAWHRESPYDAILLSGSGLLPFMDVSCFEHVRLVVDLVDVDSQKWADLAAGRRGLSAWLFGRESRHVRVLEHGATTRATACTVVSEKEAELLRKVFPRAHIHVVKNGVDLEQFQSQRPVEERRLAFVGALDYEPNVHGMEWFCQAVWPELRRRHEDVELEIIGRRPVRRVLRLGRLPGVRIAADVPDVRPHVADAMMMIAPLLVARGIQNKVLEALAMGKPTIVSPTVLGGIHARPEEEILVAESPADWLRQIARLFDEPATRASLAAAGRAFVEREHRWAEELAAFDELLELEPIVSANGIATQHATSLANSVN
jgi:sugar transferase (PEP-CTERM/EpsH1 system associated)